MEQLSTAWPVLLTAGGILILALAAIFTVRFFRNRSRGSEMDDMEGHEFEYFCADLLKDNGFAEVEVTRGSGDYGVDILAEKDEGWNHLCSAVQMPYRSDWHQGGSGSLCGPGLL